MRAVRAAGREPHPCFPALTLNTHAPATFLGMKYSLCVEAVQEGPCHSSQLSRSWTARTLFSERSSSRAFMNSLPFPFGVRTSQLSPGRA